MLRDEGRPGVPRRHPGLLTRCHHLAAPRGKPRRGPRGAVAASHPADLFRRLRGFFATDPIASRIRRETYPGPEVRSGAEEEIVRSALDGGYCGFHTVGTCAVGPGADDVTDAWLRVRGVGNLRVVDASVLPTMVSGNLNGPVMAMAWRAAEFIRDGE